jgi:hypothetical protein
MGYAGYVQLAFGESSRTSGPKRIEQWQAARASAHHQHQRFTMNAMACYFVMTDRSEPVECGQK